MMDMYELYILAGLLFAKVILDVLLLVNAITHAHLQGSLTGRDIFLLLYASSSLVVSTLLMLSFIFVATILELS